MRILRLFVTHVIDDPVNWIIVEEDGVTDGGTSTWDEFSIMENVHLEVYLKANCCSIHTLDTSSIKVNKLNDEVILGMLEDSIVDDIDEVKPILLRTEDGTSFVAMFNKQFYEGLLLRLINLGKPVRFMQPFVFCTVWAENEWTVFIDDKQQFVRVSKYEYFLLDNSKPIPILLKQMLLKNKPELINMYSDIPQSCIQDLENEYDVTCKSTSELDYGNNFWNFYNQKSTRFNVKLDMEAKNNVLSLFSTLKWFTLVMSIFWVINIIMVGYSVKSTEASIKQNISKIYPIKDLSLQSVQELDRKINDLKHQKGLYSDNDAIPMFNLFLNTVSNVGTNSIVQINYQDGILEIFLNNGFSTAQFNSYRNILLSQGISIKLVDYKTYSANNKDANKSDNNPNPDADNSQAQKIDAQWVIILQSSVMLEMKKGGL